MQGDWYKMRIKSHITVQQSERETERDRERAEMPPDHSCQSKYLRTLDETSWESPSETEWGH